jgi:hypothetical protein
MNIATTTRTLKQNARAMAADNGHELGRFASRRSTERWLSGTIAYTLHSAKCVRCGATMYIATSERRPQGAPASQSVEILGMESDARWRPCDSSHSGL